jgi:cobalt-zinc-cadmium efflux system outer membrane protein
LLKGWAFIALIAMGGCTTYRSVPITSEAVHARLRPPDMAKVRILAREIKHPILRPVELKPKEGLSPDGAAVLAVLLNPSLRAVRDQRALSNAQLLDAGLLPNPALGFSFGVPSGGDTTGRVDAYGLELNWDATSLLSRAPRRGQAKAHKEAVDLDIAWKEWQVAQAAKDAVYRLATLRSRIALAEQASRHMAREVEEIQKAVKEGAMTANVLNAAQVTSRQANETLLDLQKQADKERLQLRRLLGLPAGARIRLAKNIRLSSRMELPADTVLFEGLEQRRLDLLALRRGYASQEEAVRAAVLEQFPRISIGPTFGRDTDNIQTAGFGLSIVLPIFNRNQGKIARERATRKRLFDEYVNRVFEAHSHIELILSGIRFTTRQIAAAQATKIDLKKLVEKYRTALADGRIDALLYYQVWNDLINARMRVLTLKGQLARAAVALELASGFYEIPKPGMRQPVSRSRSREGRIP